jgi:hypothetical protein
MMDAMDVLLLICAEQNRWMEADTDQLRAQHAALAAQVLPRVPPVLPPRRKYGEGPRAMRQKRQWRDTD